MKHYVWHVTGGGRKRTELVSVLTLKVNTRPPFYSVFALQTKSQPICPCYLCQQQLRRSRLQRRSPYRPRQKGERRENVLSVVGSVYLPPTLPHLKHFCLWKKNKPRRIALSKQGTTKMAESITCARLLYLCVRVCFDVIDKTHKWVRI